MARLEFASDERPVRADQITEPKSEFDDALARAGVNPSALLLDGATVDLIFGWPRSTRERRKAAGILPTVKDGGRVRHPRKAVAELYQRMIQGA